VDTLILGCTHYPLLKEVIGEVMGPAVHLVDSAAPTIAELRESLARQGLLRTGRPRHRFCVTDASYKFMQIANGILDQDVSAMVEQVRLTTEPDQPFRNLRVPAHLLASAAS
jgi:glutamate racemase